MEINMLHILKIAGILCILSSISLIVMKFGLKLDIQTTPLLISLIITVVVVVLGYTNILKS